MDTQMAMKRWMTVDLYLAAFLVTIGLDLTTDKEEKSNRVRFYFPDGVVLDNAKLQYFRHAATVDPLSYGDNVKNLKSLCHL